MPPNILLVVLDSVRAQNTSLHGYTRDTTPFISEFGDGEIVYNQARAPSVASLPSHVSIFTGLHTEEHGFGNDDHRRYKLAKNTTIWEKLKNKYKYNTGVFSTNPYLTVAPVGIKSKFDTVVSSPQPPYENALDPRDYHDSNDGIDIRKWIIDLISSGKPIRSILNGVSIKRNAENKQNRLPSRFQPIELPTAFLNWIDNIDNQPWASCVNLMDAHTPYAPSVDYDKWSSKNNWVFQNEIEHFRWQFTGGEYDIKNLERLENLYDGAILEADDKVKSIVTGLKNRNILDNTLVIITSDHGEGFGEKSNIRPNQYAVGHTVGIHESQLHVPLVVHLPKNININSKKINELASLTEFPSVVTSVIKGKDHPEKEFITKKGPIASQPAIGKEDRDLAKSYGTDIDGVSGRMRAAYQKESDNIYKYISWENHYKKINIKKDEVVSDGESEAKMKIIDEFNNMDIKDVKIEKFTEIDEATEDRLSELGYI